MRCGFIYVFYSGYDKWDNRMGSIAGFFTIGVAWFPITEMALTPKVSLFC